MIRAYLKRRLFEKTTWAGIATVLAGAEAVETPWLRVCIIVVGVAATVLPSRYMKGKTS